MRARTLASTLSTVAVATSLLLFCRPAHADEPAPPTPAAQPAPAQLPPAQLPPAQLPASQLPPSQPPATPPPVAPPPVAPPSAEPPIQGPPGLGQVDLHITTKGKVEHADVYVLGGNDYHYLCTAPCDPIVPIRSSIAVTMPGLEEHSLTTLKRYHDGGADITIAPPGHAAKKGGWILLGLGITTLVGAVVSYAAIASTEDRPGAYLSHQAAGLLVGIPLGLVGLGLGAGGAAMLALASDAPDVSIQPRRKR
ncbi:MAG: hypothetical protein JST00_30225 [Deltaproteobacteria bacterium]|nr:hypothetical protein [Deltaproteobacteria bacterium]